MAQLTLSRMLEMVDEFHHKLGVSDASDLLTLDEDIELRLIGAELLKISQQLAQCLEKRPWLRAHLAVEENGEWLIAMGHANPVEVLDATADKLYVLLGDCVTYSLPIEEALLEVHRSNMTKKRSADDPEGDRVRDKGSEYVPPRLHEVYWLHRRACSTSTREEVASALGISVDIVKTFEHCFACSGSSIGLLEAYDEAVRHHEHRSTSRT